MGDCLFCSIAAGEVPATIVSETSRTLAFLDIAPQAPVHVVVIPRDHHADVAALTDADPALAAEFLTTATEVARGQGLLAGGYRLVINTGDDGGQTVGHVHAHVLGGRALRWPPG
jgi:histidine triad (HIT) family protein